MNQRHAFLLAAAICVVLAGCKTTSQTSDSGPSDTGSSSTSTTGMADDGRYGPEDLDRDSCLRQRVVYFDFDQDALRPEFQAIVACHAKYLVDRPGARMTLEGNADERGTREYNLGLGERRGNAVAAAVMASGGSGSQMSTVSYGEERPTCLDSTEDCWARNRRVEIVYTVK
jgi:peptidoglycan-associated lipoprotein